MVEDNGLCLIPKLNELLENKCEPEFSNIARMAELVDAGDLKSSEIEYHSGSIPALGTTKRRSVACARGASNDVKLSVLYLVDAHVIADRRRKLRA